MSTVRPAVPPPRRWPRWLAMCGVLAMLAAGAALWTRLPGRLVIGTGPDPTPDPGAGAPPAPAAVASLADAPEKSVAVLPFENLSDDRENAYFADGVQDEILTRLARVADLRVISRSSTLRYRVGGDGKPGVREIASQLGVVHLLVGSVRRVGAQVRISAQLIDARRDAHEWAESYDRDLADVFAIQGDIAQAIAGQLRAVLSPEERAALSAPPTTNLAAYDLYQRAREAFSRTFVDASRAREIFPQVAAQLERAIGLDPGFVPAHCLLTDVEISTYFLGYDRTPAHLERARVAAETALRLQPGAGEAHQAIANYYYRGFRDYARARAELETAHRLLPNNAETLEYMAYVDRRQGRWEEATRQLEQVGRIDPRNASALQQLAMTYELRRRFAVAGGVYDRVLAIVPGDLYTERVRANLELFWRADPAPLRRVYDAQVAAHPREEIGWADFSLCEGDPEAARRSLADYPEEGFPIGGVNCPRAWFEGLIARWRGDEAAARAAFTRARQTVAALLAEQPDFPAALSLLGMIDAGLGRREDAVREGRRACELLPVETDALDGMDLVENLAQIHAWCGDRDAALAQLAICTRAPGRTCYGTLKLHPRWRDLRGDPRFEALVASLAPKR